MNDYAYFWKTSIEQLYSQERIDEIDYENIFSRLNYLSYEDKLITIGANSKFISDRFSEKYKEILQEQISDITGELINLSVTVNKPNNGPSEQAKAASSLAESEEQNILEPKIVPALSQHARIDSRSKLNSEYSLDRYVVGTSNNFAFSAAQAIIKNPGREYNPFLIYGGVGLGKTHLMQAIGNELIKKNSKHKVLYVTAETFLNDFLTAIRERKQSQFKLRYRSVDTLLVDDIHDLQRKKETQEELFYTYNELYEQKKQLVFTCDRPIHELKDFTERLKSRFGLALQVDLLPPPYETRVAILETKIAELNMQIPKNITEHICELIKSNVRDLTGALTTLKAYADLKDSDLSISLVDQYLKGYYSKNDGSELTVAGIQKLVADHFNVSIDDLIGRKRTQTVVLPRQVAMFLIRENTHYSTTEIGQEFGRDHTTVMHSCSKIADLIKTDAHFGNQLEELLSNFFPTNKQNKKRIS